MIEKDAVILGAGVAGLYLSRLLEKKGIDYITFERNGQVGKYGNRIINKDVFKKLEVSKNVIIRDIRKINFFSPSETRISKASSESRGFVTNIGSLEKELFSSLEDKKRIIFSHFVNNFDLSKGVLKSKNYNIKARIVIFASGILPDFLSNTLLVNKPRVVFCYMNEVNGKDEITTILDNEKAHGFYGWVMPLDGHVEVGFGTDRIDELRGRDFNDILFSLPYIHKYKKAGKIKQFGGFIPTSIVNKKHGKNWILIGDASGGEALMGGSIHKSIDEASLAFKIIEGFLDGDIYNLNEYDKLWEGEIGKNIHEQEHIRNILDKSSNKNIDKVFKMVKGKPIEGEGLINNLFMNLILNLEKIKSGKI